MRQGFLLACLIWWGWALVASTPLARSDDVRFWSDATGKYGVQAKFIKVENDVVWLQRTDSGKVIKIPLDRLGDFDRRVAKAWAKKPPTPSKKPAGPTEDKEKPGKLATNPPDSRPSPVLQPPVPDDGYSIHVPRPVDVPNNPTNTLELSYASQRQPYVAAINRVIHLPTGRTTGTYSIGKPHPQAVPVLSPNGRYLAFTCWEMGDRTRTVLKLIDAGSDGAQKRIVLCEGTGVFTKAMDFLSNNELVWVCFEAFKPSRVVIFDVNTGEPVKKYELPTGVAAALVDPVRKRVFAHYKFTPPFNKGPNQRILRLDLETGKHETWVELERRDVYVMTCSPQGDELAFISDRQRPKLDTLDVLDSDGELIEQIALEPEVSRDRPLTIQWLPDGSGWLLGGRSLIDRKSKQFVWNLQTYTGAKPHALLLDRDYVLAVWSKAGESAKLGPVKIPRAKIERNLVAIGQAAGAVISPGQTVSLDVQVSNVRFGDKDQLAQRITEALQQSLQLRKLNADPKGELKLALDWSEATGEEVAIVERTRDNFRFRERVVGSGRETLITCDVRLEDAAGKVLWKLNISNKDKTSGSVDSSDERQWRDSRITNVLSGLRGLKLPKFIDADGNRVEMPVITEEIPR